jgi:hypothetical protein
MQKHAARQHHGADRLSHAAPASKTLLSLPRRRVQAAIIEATCRR